jgi:hypothetical protein
MGYSGPPSKACLPCRQRRIKVSNATTHLNTVAPNTHPNHQKCDLATPACNQCLRAGNVCQGYRTGIDFLFRDETKTIARKARRRKHKSTLDTSAPNAQPIASHVLASSTQASTASDFAHSFAACQPRSPQLLSPTGSVEEQAICFFFGIYATLPSTNRRQSFYAHLPKVYNERADNNILKCIVLAIGLGGLSHQRKDSELLLAAEAAYNRTLHWTNHALCHPDTASSDQTLISVMLLGLYEVRLPFSS